MNRKDDFIEIRPYIFLSKYDSLYFEKYLRYHPKDVYMRYQYGCYLEEKGKLKEARKHFLKASQYGHALSKKKINAFKQTAPSSLLLTNRHRRISWGTISLLIAAMICIALLAFLYPFNATSTEVTVHRLSSHSGTFYSDQLTPHDVQYAVVFNAIRHFQTKNGVYPSSLNQLTKPYPNNWLSYIPSDLSYSTTGRSFTLEGQHLHLPADVAELKLGYFPETHQLGIYFGQSLLALYSVANGKKPLSFNKSYVHQRVVLPNGPDSALGTRGLYLEKQIAIHGTNRPSSIGKSVSLGCLRLTNHNIEVLYPYVSIGTPFIVKDGRPIKTVMFPKGLPSISIPTISNETTPTHFSWLN